MNEHEWDEIIDGCLKSAFLVARARLPLLRRGHAPTLLNTSSTSGAMVRHAGYGLYATAKAGIINLTRVLARECAPVARINAVAPGLIDTEFLSAGTGRQRKASGVDREAVVATVPLERMGTPEDIAGAALFLASPAASYIAGQTLHVNGGIWS
jgi:3-oxoacyl-[acyl-carrier protein] reductase